MRYSQKGMAEAENKNAVAPKSAQSGFVFLPLIAGWLIPGAGHFLLRKWGRGALLAISIVCMFALGLAMQGHLYANAHDILEMLGLAGDLGSGLLYFVGRTMGLGADSVQTTRRLGHQVHRRGRPSEHHRRRRRAQHPYREEALMFSPSHFTAVLLFASSHPQSSASRSAKPREDVSLRPLLLGPLRWLRHRAQLGHVPDRALSPILQILR